MTSQTLPALYCDCTVSLARSDGASVRVRSRRWDCPSCGLDKARTLREMVITANVERLFVLTFSQPVAGPVQPARHSDCEASTHLYLDRFGVWRWRMLESCPHCCRFSSWALSKWRKSMRRRWPSFEMLWVREVKPLSGAFDVNVVVSGLPVMTRRGRSGKRVKSLWVDVGGGFLDLGDNFSGSSSPGGLGRYVGKYLTKLAHRPMARGFRRWGRTQQFAPEVKMTQPAFIGPKLPYRYMFEGWVSVLDGKVSDFRWSLDSP